MDYSCFNKPTDYLLGGGLTLRNGRVDKLQFDEGYCQATEYSGNASQDDFYLYYYDRDHLGNIRQVVKADRTTNGTVVQTMEYYPFGAQFCHSSTASEVQSRKYNGKEFDNMHGLNTYDYGARQYNPVTARWDRVDPLCEKYYSVSPYIYCGGNPINVIDPNGKSCSPIYNQDGVFLGTDDDGLTGAPIVMNDIYFKQGMSHSEAERKRMKIDDMCDEANKKMMNHYSTLPNRPDYDGYLTLDEANEWYANGKGQPLFTDLSKIDLSGIRSLGEEYVGQVKRFNLLFVSNNINDGLVYGNITLKRYPNNHVRAYADTYDFDMKSWKDPSNWFRNVETIIGKIVAGEGSPYTINIYGSKQLKPLFPWTR